MVTWSDVGRLIGVGGKKTKKGRGRRRVRRGRRREEEGERKSR